MLIINNIDLLTKVKISENHTFLYRMLHNNLEEIDPKTTKNFTKSNQLIIKIPLFNENSMQCIEFSLKVVQCIKFTLKEYCFQ